MKMSQLRIFALSLPDATEEPHFNYSSFRVRGKIFATVPPDESDKVLVEFVAGQSMIFVV